MIVSNDLLKWFQLDGVEDPSTWPGAEAFTECELDTVRAVMKTGRQRPRQIIISGLSFLQGWPRFRCCPRTPSPKRQVDVARGLRAGQVDQILPRSSKLADSCGPRAALRQLKAGGLSESDKRCWVENARLDAVLGGMQKSMKGLKSALACYASFMSKCDLARVWRHWWPGVVLDRSRLPEHNCVFSAQPSRTIGVVCALQISGHAAQLPWFCENRVHDRRRKH